MKAQVLDINGKKVKEIQTHLFEEPIREDIIFKIIESEKIKHPYKPKLYAGMNRSASGNVAHKRHSWGTDRGRGMSRFPKKTMWRRGTQFSWVGAIIPSTKGGRRAHPPKGYLLDKKINKKEYIKGLLSALSYSNSIYELKKKYTSIEKLKLDHRLPLIIEDKILSLKTKEFLNSLKHILGDLYLISIQKKRTRAGIGKLRGRRYKRNAGLLMVISSKEKIKVKGIEVIRSNKLKVSDIANNGARLTIFTENSIKELEKLGAKNA